MHDKTNPTRSDTNRPVQSQKMARCFKFWIKIAEDLYCTADLRLFSPSANCWFSYAVAQGTSTKRTYRKLCEQLFSYNWPLGYSD